MANRNATAFPPDPNAHGTGQGSPFLWLQPPCAHEGGSLVVSTVPEQPPASEPAAELVGLDVARDGGVLHPTQISRINTAANRSTTLLHRATSTSSTHLT